VPTPRPVLRLGAAMILERLTLLKLCRSGFSVDIKSVAAIAYSFNLLSTYYLPVILFISTN
jgi:hypothetical protein